MYRNYRSQQEALASAHPEDKERADVCKSVREDVERILWARADGDDFLARLTVTLPMAKIKEIFERYGVIQLRELTTFSRLLLGCGNFPADPDYSTHAHHGMITVNPELCMNPSIVGAWGIDEGLNAVLPPAHYDTLHHEAVSIGKAKEFLANKVGIEAMRCLKPGFKTVEIIRRDDSSLHEETPFETSSLFWSEDTPLNGSPASPIAALAAGARELTQWDDAFWIGCPESPSDTLPASPKGPAAPAAGAKVATQWDDEFWIGCPEYPPTLPASPKGPAAPAAPPEVKDDLPDLI